MSILGSFWSSPGGANPYATHTGTISLTTTWTGQGPYTQTVTVSGARVSDHSKVDLQLTAAQIATLMADGVTALTIENNYSTLTVYALGAAPTTAMTIQCSVVEVAP